MRQKRTLDPIVDHDDSRRRPGLGKPCGICTTQGRLVIHLCINCAFCTDSCFRTVSHMKRLARLTAMTVLVTAGLGLADMTIATPVHAQVGGYATHGHGGGGCMACRGLKHK